MTIFKNANVIFKVIETEFDFVFIDSEVKAKYKISKENFYNTDKIEKIK